MPLLSLGQGNYWTTGGVLLWLIWLVVVVGLLFVWYCNYLVVLWCSLAVGCCHLFSEHTWLAGIVLCGDVLSGWFCLNCCAQCITMHLLVLLQPQCTHTQLLLYCTSVHSLTAFVSSLPQVQTSHAALGPREDRCTYYISGYWRGRSLTVRPTYSFRGRGSDLNAHYYWDSPYFCMYVCMYAAMDTLK